MPTSLSRTLAYFSLGGLILVSTVLISLWGPEVGLLQDAHRAEAERLYQAFSAPLARALAQNDDLARIDELRRLQKFPGVDSAQVSENTRPLLHGNALVWEGKTVGQFEIHLLKTRWRLWRYRWLERALSLCVFFALAFGVAGFFWNRSQERHRQRVVDMLRREHARQKRQREKDKVLADVEHKRWLLQAMEWTTKGLLVLDGRQRIVMANTAAMDHFKLGQHVLGSHWLDLAGSPEWAAALRQSVENPGVRTPGPSFRDSKSISLLTFSRPAHTLPESTWILVDQPVLISKIEL